jgi:hypothetical protein
MNGSFLLNLILLIFQITKWYCLDDNIQEVTTMHYDLEL